MGYKPIFGLEMWSLAHIRFKSWSFFSNSEVGLLKKDKLYIN